MSRPKWAFQYLVHGNRGVETFDSGDYANKYAVATRGKVWAIEDVADYTPQTVSIKNGHTPLASY